MSPNELNAVLRSRRAIFPKQYDPRPLPPELLETILENANWAPTHKLTEPWRFKVFTGESLPVLGQFLAEEYRKTTPVEKYSDRAFDKNLQKPVRSSCVIAICMARDTDARVPEWEEIAAVACAVQNMWLTCSVNGIGCYWSTTSLIMGSSAAEFLELAEHERCLGLFYMGYYEGPALQGKRTPVSEKVSWYTAKDSLV